MLLRKENNNIGNLSCFCTFSRVDGRRVCLVWEAYACMLPIFSFCTEFLPRMFIFPLLLSRLPKTGNHVFPSEPQKSSRALWHLPLPTLRVSSLPFPRPVCYDWPTPSTGSLPSTSSAQCCAQPPVALSLLGVQTQHAIYDCGEIKKSGKKNSVKPRVSSRMEKSLASLQKAKRKAREGWGYDCGRYLLPSAKCLEGSVYASP